MLADAHDCTINLQYSACKPRKIWPGKSGPGHHLTVLLSTIGHYKLLFIRLIHHPAHFTPLLNTIILDAPYNILQESVQVAEPIKTKSGKWQVTVCVKRVRKTETFRTKGEAKLWASETELMLRGQAAGNTRTTLSQLFDRYASEVSEHKKGAQWELVRLKMFKRFPVASIKLKDIQREQIEDYIDLRLKTVKPSSVNRELNLMSHCFTQARRWRLMSHEPMKDLKRPKNPPARDRRIVDSETELILHCLNYDDNCSLAEPRQRVGAAFLFAIESGMRAGEICNLEAKNIYLDKAVAHLPETKNGKARDVALLPRAVDILSRVLYLNLSPVFGLKSGALSSIFKAAREKAGIDDLTFHDSRHEAITRLAKKLDVLALARTVGHSNINQLQTYYNESAEDIARKLRE